MHLYPSAISIQVRWVGGFAFFKTPCSQFAERGLCGCMDSEFHDEIIKDVELYTDTANPIDLVTGDALPDSSGIVDLVHGEDGSPPFDVESSVEAIEPLSELHSVDPSALRDHVDQPVSFHEDGSVQLVESTIFHCAVSTSPFCFHGSVVVPPLLCALCYCAHWRWGFGVWRGSAVIRFYKLRLFVVLHFLVLCLAGIFWVRILCHRSRLVMQ